MKVIPLIFLTISLFLTSSKVWANGVAAAQIMKIVGESGCIKRACGISSVDDIVQFLKSIGKTPEDLLKNPQGEELLIEYNALWNSMSKSNAEVAILKRGGEAVGESTNSFWKMAGMVLNFTKKKDVMHAAETGYLRGGMETAATSEIETLGSFSPNMRSMIKSDPDIGSEDYLRILNSDLRSFLSASSPEISALFRRQGSMDGLASPKLFFLSLLSNARGLKLSVQNLQIGWPRMRTGEIYFSRGVGQQASFSKALLQAYPELVSVRSAEALFMQDPYLAGKLYHAIMTIDKNSKAKVLFNKNFIPYIE